MAVSDADRVGWADDGVANVDAGSSPKNSFPADFTWPTLSISSATGDDLTNTGQLVLSMAFLASTKRSSIDNLALLSIWTGHDLARIQTGSSSIDVDLANQSFWTLTVLLAFLFREAAFL